MSTYYKASDTSTNKKRESFQPLTMWTFPDSGGVAVSEFPELHSSAANLLDDKFGANRYNLRSFLDRLKNLWTRNVHHSNQGMSVEFSYNKADLLRRKLTYDVRHSAR